jgi:AcrR family transcriptional regulator
MVSGADEKILTAKGSRQAEAVLHAAVRCIGADGYSGTSLQRVADEAGVQKRMVLYYFGSRERLVAAALRHIADGFIAELRARVAGLHEPGPVIDAMLDLVMEQAEDRALLAAYFGLLAEAATDPILHEAFEEARERVVALAHEVLDDLEAHGRTLSMERELLILGATTAAHGIGLELLQHGRTPQFERAFTLVRAGAPLLLFD